MDELPEELLRVIFRQLDGRSVGRCRRVCQRWLQFIDSFSDVDWKEICGNENDDFEKVKEKYGISWHDTYKAVNSWSEIEFSETTSKVLCDHKVERFKVLPNNIVVVLKNKRHPYSLGCSDTVFYYKNFELLSEEEYDFAFYSRQYEENEYFIVLVQECGKLTLILKENKKTFIVGWLDTRIDYLEPLIFDRFDNFSLIKKEVYFKNSTDDIIYVSKIKPDNGASTVITERVVMFLLNQETFQENVVAFAIQDGNLHILSDYDDSGNVYICKNSDLEWVMQVDYDCPDAFLQLKEFGFDWRSRPIYHWLCGSTNLYKKTAFYTHGKMYIAPRYYGRVVCIHYHPDIVFGRDDVLKILKGKAQKKICIKDLLPFKQAFVNQLDIVEDGANPKILMLVASKLFLAEITFDTKEEKKRKLQALKYKIAKRKRKLSQINLNKTVKKVPKGKKSIQCNVAKRTCFKRNTNLTKHRYPTRLSYK